MPVGVVGFLCVRMYEVNVKPKLNIRLSKKKKMRYAPNLVNPTVFPGATPSSLVWLRFHSLYSS